MVKVVVVGISAAPTIVCLFLEQHLDIFVFSFVFLEEDGFLKQNLSQDLY
jgi:hypothetical protein